MVFPPGKTPSKLFPLLTDADLASEDSDKLLNEDEDASTDANSFKPKKGTTDEDNNAPNGSSNEADNSPKYTNMGGYGLEVVPASTTKPFSNKGVGFAGDKDVIQDKGKNRLTTTSSTTPPLTSVPLPKKH